MARRDRAEIAPRSRRDHAEIAILAHHRRIQRVANELQLQADVPLDAARAGIRSIPRGVKTKLSKLTWRCGAQEAAIYIHRNDAAAAEPQQQPQQQAAETPS